jgi:Flp pilus assembly protein TadB
MSPDLDPMVLTAAMASAISIGGLVAILIPSPRRLRGRIRPYVVPHLDPLGSSHSRGVLHALFAPMARDLADRLASIIDRSGHEATLIRLRQAGWYPGLDEPDMIARYRMTQLKTTLFTVLLGAGLSVIIGTRPVVGVALVGSAAVVGLTRTRGRLERAIQQRRELMRIEIYTVNQLLAMRVRAGGGVIHAVKAVTHRGKGEVVSELEEALRLHRAGWPGPDAFRRIAELTPEPFCARTYRLLAAADERGADLGAALLALSEDVRETRREAIKRTGTRRRAGMLIPTIAILAPVLILFVAAPLPYLITRWQ